MEWSELKEEKKRGRASFCCRDSIKGRYCCYNILDHEVYFPGHSFQAFRESVVFPSHHTVFL